jgi:hypothetical protein
MSHPSRSTARAWILALLAALGLVLWADYMRGQRVELVSRVAADGLAADASSPTGYADGKRWLVVPEHNNATYQWIMETQAMEAGGGLRIRHIAYENAPVGRDVHTASPYRWWLLSLAWVHHEVTGSPLARSVERAALFADPLLHALLLVGATLFAVRQFGRAAGALVAIMLAAVFPVAATFLPGVASDFGLLQASCLASLFLLLAGAAGRRVSPACFLLSGVAGGFALWLQATQAAPFLFGAAVGGCAATAVARARPGRQSGADDVRLPWRAWALGGACSSLAAYLVEYFPSHMDFQLRVNYPLYALAWLGLGECVHRADAWLAPGGRAPGWRGILAWVLAVLGAASLPVAAALTKDMGFLADDPLAARLTNLPDGVVAPGVVAWITRDGMSAAAVAAFLPLALLVPGLWTAARPVGTRRQRIAVGIALGCAFAALAMTLHQVRWWATVDVALIGLAAVLAAAAARRPARWVLAGITAASIAAAASQLAPLSVGTGGDLRFTRAEAEELYERSIAHWIKDHVGADGATVLAPPYRTPSLCFYGGLSGLGTPNWENREGLSATYRIITSTRPDETLALLQERGVTHIVVPSWDTDFDELAKMGLRQPTDSFIFALHKTDGGIFSWLRALPYTLPSISGFDEHAVLLLQVTDESDPATVRGRLVEYLLEMHQLDQAAYSSQALLRYPSDLGAHVALAQVAKARDDAHGFDTEVAAVVSNLSGAGERRLAWDRRAGLAVVLELGGHEDLARVQVERCARDMSADRLRSLTTGNLYHLLVLFRHFGVELKGGELRSLSLKLLPPELRERLSGL